MALPIWPEKGGVKADILICNGADDPFIPEATVTNYKNKMDSASVEYTYISFPGVVHSFTSKDADERGKKFELPMVYDAEADSTSWAEMKKLFKASFE